MSGKKARSRQRNPFASGKRGCPPMGGGGTGAQRESEGTLPSFLEENGMRASANQICEKVERYP